MTLCKHQIDCNKQTIIAQLENTKREGIEKLIGFLTESDYFTAPASSKLDYHSAYEGGLAKHSLDVQNLFEQKVELFTLPVPKSSQIITSYCHDLCKVNHYKPNILKDGRISDAKPYITEDELPLGHGEKSLYIARSFIKLTPQEAILIRWHMGPYDPAWEQYGEKVQEKFPEILAFQTSDNEASKYLR